MDNLISIQFDLDTTDASAALGFELWLDSQLLIDIDHVRGPQHIRQLVSDEDGEHELKFVLKNKTSDHTQINEQGDIVKDARLLIKNVKFDEIELGYDCFTKLARYHHSYNTDQEPVAETFYGEMGCNGCVVLQFTTPGYLWLLENM
jgi:hypothetical protein